MTHPVVILLLLLLLLLLVVVGVILLLLLLLLLLGVSQQRVASCRMLLQDFKISRFQDFKIRRCFNTCCLTFESLSWHSS